MHAEQSPLGEDRTVQRLQARLLSQLHTLDAHDLSNCLWALAVMRSASRPLLDAVPQLWLTEQAWNKEATLADNARVLWSLSELRAIPPVCPAAGYPLPGRRCALILDVP
jgi:hypothetical protein